MPVEGTPRWESEGSDNGSARSLPPILQPSCCHQPCCLMLTGRSGTMCPALGTAPAVHPVQCSCGTAPQCAPACRPACTPPRTRLFDQSPVEVWAGVRAEVCRGVARSDTEETLQAQCARCDGEDERRRYGLSRKESKACRLGSPCLAQRWGWILAFASVLDPSHLSHSPPYLCATPLSKCRHLCSSLPPSNCPPEVPIPFIPARHRPALAAHGDESCGAHTCPSSKVWTGQAVGRPQHAAGRYETPLCSTPRSTMGTPCGVSRCRDWVYRGLQMCFGGI